jgi:hypothetical protein
MFNLSGAATATLPTAVGIAGKIYVIGTVASGSSLVLTINTTSSQTIGVHASGALKMAIAGDSITVQSDGSNWKILSMNITVTAMYLGGSAVSLNTTGTLNTFSTKVHDSLSCVSGSVFTAPFAGKYQASMQVFSINVGTNAFNLALTAAGNTNRAEQFFPAAGQGCWKADGIWDLAAGQTIFVNVPTAMGSGVQTYASNIDIWFSIARIGD